MSVPQHKRETARREILKQAKALEQYTIKKLVIIVNFTVEDIEVFQQMI